MNASSESGEWATRIVRLIMTPSGKSDTAGAGRLHRQRADDRPDGRAGQSEGQGSVTNHTRRAFLQTDSPPESRNARDGQQLAAALQPQTGVRYGWRIPGGPSTAGEDADAEVFQTGRAPGGSRFPYSSVRAAGHGDGYRD